MPERFKVVWTMQAAIQVLCFTVYLCMTIDNSLTCCVQKLDLLAKENVILRDRQLLSRQVEFLQQQLVTPTFVTPADTDKQTDTVCHKLNM